MPLPFFYIETFDKANERISLNEETSKHVIQVLRMTTGETLRLTDGRGSLITAEILEPHRKKCSVNITSVNYELRRAPLKSIAVSPVKNNSRFEWLLEKTAEIGLSAIVPILCTRSEKQQLRMDRMKGILISAMLQSQQSWLPELQEPQKLDELINGCGYTQKFLAHCENGVGKENLSAVCDRLKDSIVLIGPEGDFTPEEINNALSKGFTPVSLGNTRLRTETAGMVAATILMNA